MNATHSEISRRSLLITGATVAAAAVGPRNSVAAEEAAPVVEVQKGLDEIGFTGWTTAEGGGGGLERLTLVRQQMQKAFGLS